MEGIGSVLSGGLGLIGTAVADLFSGQDQEEIDRLIQESLDEYGNIDLPKLKQLAAQQQGGTEFDKVKVNPALEDAQMRALSTLGREYDQEGMTPEDRAAYEEFQSAASQKEKANRDALHSRMRPGSGQSAALMALNQQAGADRAHSAATSMAGDARMRALQSMTQYGQMAGAMRDQSHGEQSRRAQAQDAINNFNTRMRADTDLNNNRVAQDQFNNNLQVGDRRNTIRGRQVDRRYESIDRRRKYGQAIGSTVGAGLGAL